MTPAQYSREGEQQDRNGDEGGTEAAEYGSKSLTHQSGTGHIHQYGSKACEYLFGTKSTIVYKIAFVLMIFIGCTMNLGLAWDLSDTFNGLMAIPNLIGVIALSPVVMKITKNYVARIIKKEDVKPMLSVFPEIQEEQEKAM